MKAGVRRRALAVGLAGVLGGVATAPVRGGELEDLRLVVSDLEKRLKQLEGGRDVAAQGGQGGAAAEKRRETAGWENGFFLRSSDGETSLRIRAQVQVDGRFMMEDQHDRRSSDTFLLRRVRPSFEGSLFNGIDFRVLPEFAGSRLEILDAYINARAGSGLQLRVGKGKAPFGIERLQSSTAMRFQERALSDNLVPNRDIGAMVHGELAEQQIAYQFGVFNGVADGGSAETDGRDAKDVMGRLFVQPFRSSGIAPLAGLGIGIAGSRGRQQGTTAISAFRTPVSRETFFSYRTGSEGEGTHWRVSPQLSWYWGPVGVVSELVRSDQEVSRNSDRETLSNRAWQVQLAWVLTGESASYRGISPKQPFSPTKGGLGAIEWVARYSRLDVDDDAFPLFADAATSASRASSWGVGVNWWWNANLNWLLSYEETKFDGGAGAGDRETERAILTRMQLAF